MQENKILKFLSFMWNPLSWVMEAAAVMAIVLANGGVSKLNPGMTFHFRVSRIYIFLHFILPNPSRGNVKKLIGCVCSMYNLRGKVQIGKTL